MVRNSGKRGFLSTVLEAQGFSLAAAERFCLIPCPVAPLSLFASAKLSKCGDEEAVSKLGVWKVEC
jgi:hypothetical protein